MNFNMSLDIYNQQNTIACVANVQSNCWQDLIIIITKGIQVFIIFVALFKTMYFELKLSHFMHRLYLCWINNTYNFM